MTRIRYWSAASVRTSNSCSGNSSPLSITSTDSSARSMPRSAGARLRADAELPDAAARVDGPPCSGTEAVARLDTIPGVGTRVAEILVAEIGRDMSRFPSANHLASWAGLVPGHHESAGKRLSVRTRKGSPALRVALVEAARAAARTRSYLAASFAAWLPDVGPSERHSR
jgi:transposase